MKFREYMIKRPPETDIGIDIACAIIEFRMKRDITQTQLARMVGTKQPSIARLEDGAYLPSLKFLKKVTDALGIDISIKFRKKPSL